MLVKKFTWASPSGGLKTKQAAGHAAFLAWLPFWLDCFVLCLPKWILVVATNSTNKSKQGRGRAVHAINQSILDMSMIST